MTTTTSYTEELGRQRTPQFAVLFPAALPGGFSQVHRPPRLSKVVTAEGESQRLFSTRVGTKASEAEGMLQRPPGAEAEGGACTRQAVLRAAQHRFRLFPVIIITVIIIIVSCMAAFLPGSVLGARQMPPYFHLR